LLIGYRAGQRSPATNGQLTPAVSASKSGNRKISLLVLNLKASHIFVRQKAMNVYDQDSLRPGARSLLTTQENHQVNQKPIFFIFVSPTMIKNFLLKIAEIFG